MVINSERLFTFKQRADELIKALKRKYTEERKLELESIERQLKDIGQSFVKRKSTKG